MQHLNNPKRKARTDAKLFLSLEKHGNVGLGCKEAGISRSTYYRWRSEDAAFARRCDACIRLGKEEINDRVQARLMQLIEQGSARAITFHLSRRHPDYRWPKVETDRLRMLEKRRDWQREAEDWGAKKPLSDPEAPG